MKKNKIFLNLRVIIYGGLFGVIVSFYFILVMPVFLGVKYIGEKVNLDSQELKNHVTFFTQLTPQRTHKSIESLDKAASYIYDSFLLSNCDDVKYQTFQIEKDIYKNVICTFTGKTNETIVVGAHYDVFGEYTKQGKQILFGTYQGADDNASGVAGLLTLARLIGDNTSELEHTIELVTYTLEEPPYFDSTYMGSYVHAMNLKEMNVDVKYMISLEMIGYFSDEPIQEYPFRFLSRIYPKKADFIAIIGKFFDTNIKDIKIKMQQYGDIPVYSLSAPIFIPGIDFSDHRNYWNAGYIAYMITDTSFFRNKNYHTAGDTIETLDFEKMKEVVKGVYAILTQ